MKAFSMGEAIRFGWQTTLSNILVWIIILIVVAVLEAIPNLLTGRGNENAALACVGVLLGIVIQTLVQMSLIRIELDFVDHGRADFAALGADANHFVNFLLASLLFGIMAGIGFVLLIIPGIIVAILFGFYGYVVVDRGLGPIDALARSAALTQGVRVELFLFGLLLIGINVLGVLALVIGLFVTIPTTVLALTYVYRRLDEQTAAPAAA